LSSRVDSSGTTRPSSLIVNLDPAGVIVGGLLVEDKDKDSSKLERLSFSCSLLFGEGMIALSSSRAYPPVSWRIIKLRSPKQYEMIL